LVFEDSLDRETILQRFDFDICEEKTEGRYNNKEYKTRKVEKKFCFFRNKQNDRSFAHFYGTYSYGADFKFSLPPQLRAIAFQYYEPPKGATLEGLKEINAIHKYTNGERDIFLELPRLIAYAKQGQIKITTKGKPQASTLGKMQRKLNLQEFYPNASEKELKTIRTSLLAALIVIIPKLKNEMESAQLIKMLIKDHYTSKFSSLHGIITYLKGTGYIDEYYAKSVESDLFNILKQLPQNEWVSIENLEIFLKYQFLDLNIVTKWVASEKLYYNYEEKTEATEWRRSYTETKHTIIESRYYDSLTLPLVKGTLMLFAAWGLLDVAYRDVNATIIGKTCQSPYDGLQYIRLNKLGAYVVDQEAIYEISDAVGESTIKLSEDSLTIITPENDATASIILEPYAERVSPNRYRTDYPFFLKECRSKKDLENKIKLFKQTVSADLPPNWVNFFKELEGKINPLQKVTNVQILKIPADNSALIKLIARDKTLKKLCIKAEGYHILVEKPKMSRFKKRLQEFGYLLT